MGRAVMYERGSDLHVLPDSRQPAAQTERVMHTYALLLCWACLSPTQGVSAPLSLLYALVRILHFCHFLSLFPPPLKAVRGPLSGQCKN